MTVEEYIARYRLNVLDDRGQPYKFFITNFMEDLKIDFSEKFRNDQSYQNYKVAAESILLKLDTIKRKSIYPLPFTVSDGLDAYILQIGINLFPDEMEQEKRRKREKEQIHLDFDAFIKMAAMFGGLKGFSSGFRGSDYFSGKSEETIAKRHFGYPKFELELLGLTHPSDVVLIKKAYRKQAMVCHPDKPDGSNAKFNELNEAYKICIEYYE